MKFLVFLIMMSLSLSFCKVSHQMTQLTEKKCGQYTYGRIEFKRSITTEEKNQLTLQGLLMQDFIFENIYLGLWYKSWDKKNLNKTAIRTLIPFSPDDKLAGGLLVRDIKADDNSNCLILIQTIGPLSKDELNDYGLIISSNDDFYKMEVQKRNILPLLDHPCIKMVSLVKEDYIHDAKTN